VWPESFGHELRNGGDRATVVHQLAEQRTKQEQRKELRNEACGRTHEGLGPVGEQWIARESRRDQCRDGRQPEHAPAAKSQPDEQSEAEQDAE
jgi:hypothetical protein